MSSVLVGMFDTQAAAEQARAQLTSAGFSAGQVTGSSGASSSTAELSSASTSAPQDEGGIAGFFRSLFGSDDAVNTNDHSSTYREAFRRGGYVLTVNVVEEDEIERVTDILEDCGAVDVDERAQQWRNEGWSGYSATGTTQPAVGTDIAAGATQKVNLVEESIAVGKRAVGRGGVRVFSRVVEVPVEETVRLREEHAEVQRRVVDRPATEADFAAFKEGTIEVRSTAEEAVVAKSARVVGEVEIGKQVTERDEVVHDTVRKTAVDVEQLQSVTAEDAQRNKLL
jgi:stress response protein YsnF